MNADTGRIYSNAADIEAAQKRGERLVYIDKPTGSLPLTEADFRAVERAEAKRLRKALARATQSLSRVAPIRIEQPMPLPKIVPEKGERGGDCARRACHNKGALWFNKSTGRFYCKPCARIINDENRADAMEIYGRELCETTEGEPAR